MNSAVVTSFFNYFCNLRQTIENLVVNLSTCEGATPLTLIEALVSGLPIITIRFGGISEYTKDGSAKNLEKG